MSSPIRLSAVRVHHVRLRKVERQRALHGKNTHCFRSQDSDSLALLALRVHLHNNVFDFGTLPDHRDCNRLCHNNLCVKLIRAQRHTLYPGGDCSSRCRCKAAYTIFLLKVNRLCYDLTSNNQIRNCILVRQRSVACSTYRKSRAIVCPKIQHQAETSEKLLQEKPDEMMQHKTAA